MKIKVAINGKHLWTLWNVNTSISTSDHLQHNVLLSKSPKNFHQ